MRRNDLVGEFRVRRLGHVAGDVRRLSPALRAAQGDLPIGVRPGCREEPATGRPLDGRMAAGRASESLPVTVGQDQLESFRCSILLDRSTSHLWASLQGRGGAKSIRAGDGQANRPLDGGAPNRMFSTPEVPGDLMAQPAKPTDFVPVADVEVASVTPERAGFTLEGRGADRSDYRLGLELEVPLDQRTRSVLGEMLSQCRIRVWRRAAAPRKGAAHPPQAGANVPAPTE